MGPHPHGGSGLSLARARPSTTLVLRQAQDDPEPRRRVGATLSLSKGRRRGFAALPSGASRGAATLVVSLAVVAACATSETPLALGGTIVTPDRVIPDGTVVIRGERIDAIFERAIEVPGARLVRTNGVILPGLIDLHNHLGWNALPRWSPRGAYASRDAWLASKTYRETFAAVERALRRRHACDLNLFAEVRAVVGGVTAIQGTIPGPCDPGLVRNLDEGPRLAGLPGHAKPVLLLDVESLSPNEARALARRLASGVISALFVHLAEARPGDPGAREEFAALLRYELLTDRTTIVHGIGLGDAEFEALQRAGAALVWSPRSNMELYGETTSLPMALDRGIPVALAPDWALTGSSNMLDELRYAADWSRQHLGDAIDARRLVEMVTTVPAALAGVGAALGAIRPGLYADLLVIRGDRSDPYRALVNARAQDVELVLVGGRAVYGPVDRMRELRGWLDTESIELCGSSHAIDTTAGAGSLMDLRKRFRAVRRRLSSALTEARPGMTLAPVAECD